MSRTGGFLSVLLLMTAFAGCTGEPEAKAASGVPDDAADSAGGANITLNETLVAVIVVTIDGNVTEPLNGTIAAVTGTNVTFDGSNSTGDNLTFAWDFGDNATATNSSATHAYASPGSFNVTLAITRGNTTVDTNVLLNVTSGAPVGGVVWMDTKSFTGTLPVGNPNAANAANTDHRDHVVTILAADPNGTAVIAKRVRWTLDGSGPAAVDMTLYWRQGTTNLATGSTANTADETIVYEGDMLPGDYVIRVRFNAGVNASYTVTGEIDYDAA